MEKEDKMTLNERRKYLRKQQSRYYAADLKERGRLLDEMRSITGLHRKVPIRLMHSDLKRKLRQKQRGRTYGSDVEDALRITRKSYDGICAERLASNLGKMAQQHMEDHVLDIPFLKRIIMRISHHSFRKEVPLQDKNIPFRYSQFILKTSSSLKRRLL